MSHTRTPEQTAALALAITGDEGTLKTQPLKTLRAVFTEVTGETNRSPNRTFLARKIIAGIDHDARWTALRAEIDLGIADHEPLTLDAADRALLRHRLGQHPEVDAILDTIDPALTLDTADMKGITALDDTGAWPTDDAEAETSTEDEVTPTDDAPEPEPEDDATRARRYVDGELKPRHMTVPQLRIAYRLAVGRDTGSTHKNYLVWKIREAIKGNITVGEVKRGGGTREPGEDVKVLPLRLGESKVTAMDAAVERLGYPSRMAFLRDAIGSLLASKGEADAAALFTG